LLAAAWNFTSVFAGVVAVHDRVDQVVECPTAGFASFSEETSVPEGVYPVTMYVLKLKSLVESAVQFEPLSVEKTRCPLAYEPGDERIQKYPPAEGVDTGRTISAYCTAALSVAGAPKFAA
jgi:hypothetical protein